eukprot:scaffold153799_cov29-Tisochrysis_lutea.AAC.8
MAWQLASPTLASPFVQRWSTRQSTQTKLHDARVAIQLSSDGSIRGAGTRAESAREEGIPLASELVANLYCRWVLDDGEKHSERPRTLFAPLLRRITSANALEKVGNRFLCMPPQIGH